MDPIFTNTVHAIDLSASIQALVGVAILGLTFWLLTGGQRPIAGIPVVDLSDGSKKKPWQFGTHAFLTRAAEVLEKGKEISNNGVYQIKAATGYKVVLPSTFANEIRNNKDLSFVEASKKDFHAHNPGFDGLAEGARRDDLLQDIIRIRLTQSLGLIMDDVVDEAEYAVNMWFPPTKEWKTVEIKEAMLEIVSRVSSRIFGGIELSRNEKWIPIAKDYTVTVFSAAHGLDGWPAFLRPIAVWFLEPNCKKSRELVREARQLIAPTVQQRIQTWKGGDKANKNHLDVFHWALDVQKGRPVNFVGTQLAFGVAAIHTTTEMVTRCILQMCEMPEIMEPLREEIISVLKQDGWAKTSLSKMKLLDSFIKECMRVHPMSITSMMRISDKPLTLSNGIRIPAGTSIMVRNDGVRDSSINPNPDAFDPYRYYKLRQQPGEESKHQFVSTSADNLGFGHGIHACPGRFFASNEIKIMLCFMLVRCEWSFVPGQTKMSPLSKFETALQVAPDVKVRYRERQNQEIDLKSPQL